MKFSKESLEKLRKIFKEDYGQDLNDKDLHESAFNLVGLSETLLKCAYNDVQNYWRLEKEPNGYRPEEGKEYLCALCKDQLPGNEGWIDKFGFKCKLCQRAVNDGIVPGSICKDRRSWFSRTDLKRDFGINPTIARSLVSKGKLKSRTVLNEAGKAHLVLYLREENWKYLKTDKISPDAKRIEEYDLDVAKWAKEFKEKMNTKRQMRKKRNPKFKVEVIYKELPDKKDRVRQLWDLLVGLPDPDGGSKDSKSSKPNRPKA